MSDKRYIALCASVTTMTCAAVVCIYNIFKRVTK